MVQPNLPNLKPGDLIAGQFRIVEMIGSGGFSIVYRAHQEAMNRFVAIKVLKPRAANDPSVVERFRREALYASHLTHPNTITLFDYGQTENNLFYIAMEHLKGYDLSVMVQRGQPMALTRVWKILIQCCRSLGEAHRLGLVHRDLKPENIFLVQRDEGEEFIKVLDFGVSKALNNFASAGHAGPSTMAPLTQEGTVFGTPLYMAPEQAMAEQITPAVDVYAMGHIAFEMITGRAAYWDCTNPMDVMLRQVNDPPLALPKPWNKTPFSRLITKCTQKNPKKRITDASKLLEMLMGEAFTQYTTPADKPSIHRSSPNMTALRARQENTQDDLQIEDVYRWEFEVLEETLKHVKTQHEPRVVVIRGKPGTGRSNLLRAFLRHVKNQGNVSVIHRQTAGNTVPANAGLEADLAQAAGIDVKNRTSAELKRIVFDRFGDDAEAHDVDTEAELDSGPLSTLMNMRDTFLSRMSRPLRDLASQQPVIWGVENLERIDTLTVSFLDRFVRDLQSHPAPILIIVTVSPTDIEQRPGMNRYNERILNLSQPFGRQLSLIPPGEKPPASSPTPVPQKETKTQTAEEMSVSAPFLESKDHNFGEFKEERDPITSPISIEASMFDDELEEETPTPAPKSMGDETYDRVVGFLAQLGDEVPYGLWRKVCESMFDARLGRVAPLILEQAERFGILHQSSDMIYFTKRGYLETLREEFESRHDAEALHLGFANVLNDYFPHPTREQLSNIIYHLVRSQQQSLAVELLQKEGQAAFRALDFDAAREYYLQIQQLMDFLPQNERADLDGDGIADTMEMERPRLWLRLGEIHGALHEHGAAEDALMRALDEALEHDHVVLGRANKLLGDLNANKGRFAGAMKHYENAQEYFRLANMARAFVSVTAEMGHCTLMQGHPQTANTILDQALDLAEKLKDTFLLARTHYYMGQMLTRRAMFHESLEHLELARTGFESLNREIEVILCLEELGNAAFASSQYTRARNYLAKAITHAAKKHVSLARSPHLGLARAMAALGDTRQAGHQLQEALDHAKSARQPFYIAEVHLHLGDTFLAQSMEEEAQYHYDKVIQVAKTIGHTRLWLDALIRKAYVCFDMNQSEQSYQLLTQAAEMAKAIGDRDAELQVRTHLIYFQVLEHNFQVKGDTFSSLIAMGKKMRLNRTPILCWLFRADISAARKDFETARDELKQAYIHAAQLGDYALFISIARRDNLLQHQLNAQSNPDIGAGYALGALIPPEIAKRRFNTLPGHI